MQHVIRKQTIQLQLSKKADAFEMQHLMSSHYWRSVVPVLEKLFDEVCPDGETISIDKIEIDLGVITYKEMYSQQWSEALLSEIATQFYEKLSAGAAGTKATVQLQPSRSGLVQQWLYYMQHGYLAWNTIGLSEASKQQVPEALAQDKESIRTLKKLLLTDSRILSRITAQHKADFLLQLTEILASAKLPRLSLLLQELEQVLHHMQNLPDYSAILTGNSIRSQLWSLVLRFAAAREQVSDEKAMVLHVLDYYLHQPPYLLKAIQGLPTQPAQLLPYVKEWIALKNNMTAEKTEPGPIKLTTSDPPQEARENQPAVLDDKAEVEAPSIDEEGIFVQHAGLILLHPFLSTCFGRLQLTKDGRFTDNTSQQKALYLLHYLATGELTAEEYEMVIPKVLCAYPLQKPVSENSGLRYEETAEADQLLEEVIRQWEVLKSTSPDGLRAEFLHRNGKLLTKNNKLHLQVEASPVDILLDYLPWNLSMIKLPWMKEILRVEWR